MNTKSSNRWLIAAAGVVMQVALGAVYAWSVFPLTQSYGWTVSQVTLVFELKRDRSSDLSRRRIPPLRDRLRRK